MMLDFNDLAYSTTDANGNPTQTADDAAKNYTGGHMKLLQITSSDWSNSFFSPKRIASYPAGGLSDSRQNTNCTGNIQINQDGDNYVEAWVLSTNQGIAYYYTGNPPESTITDPTISASPSALAFSATVNESQVKTVNVAGSNLTGAITASLSGANAAMWTVSPGSLSGSGSISITYLPTAKGSHSATLTLSSAGATDVEIALTGEATVAQVIEGYSLAQNWAHTSGHLTANTNSRWATAMDGKIYVNDHANSKLYYWSESGLTDTGIASAAGTAITSDQAGNIILPTSFYSSGCTSMKILPAGGNEFQAISLTLPADVTASTLQYMCKAVGNVMSADGGAIFVFPSGATKVAKIIIANGEQVSATAIDVSPVKSDGQSLALPLTSDVNSDLIAVRNRTSGYQHFYLNDSGSFTACQNHGISTTQGGTIFKLADTYFAVEPVMNGNASDVAYIDGFQVVNLKTNEVVATHQAQLSESACKPNPNCITAEVVDDKTVKLYQYVPGQLAAQYSFTISTKDEPVDLDITSVTSLVNYIIGSSTEAESYFDYNADGNIDIADVTAIVNAILK